MTQNAITQRPSPSSIQEFDRRQVDIIRGSIAPDLSDMELSYFLEVARARNLNPLTRQIYAIKRQGRVTLQTGIDGFRAIADRTGLYAGQLGPFWCGEDGEWRDAWLKKDPPAAAKVGVLRKDFAEPIWGVAKFTEYSAGGPMWTKMASNQIAKCAEALALRKAFPDEISGLYTGDEMDQAEAPVPQTASSPEPTFRRSAPRPITPGATVPLPGSSHAPVPHEPEQPVSRITGEPVEDDPAPEVDAEYTPVVDGSGTLLRETVLALGVEVVTRSRPKLAEQPQQVQEGSARAYLQKFNPDKPWDEWDAGMLIGVEEKLRARLEKA